jgi:hypothetical protein
VPEAPAPGDLLGFVPATEALLAHPQRIPERSHEKPVLPWGRAFYPVQVALLAAVYFGAAKAGLSMAFVAEQVTAITGVAITAVGVTAGGKGRRQDRRPPHRR